MLFKVPRQKMYEIPKTPKTIKLIIYSNILIYFAFLILTPLGIDITTLFGIVPSLVLEKYYAWQFITYMFIHGNLFHLLFNMLMLWMLGTELYIVWGNRFFIKYYFLCGIGASVSVVFLSFLNPSSSMIPTIGSSGAIFGLLLAYGLIFKNRVLYVLGIIPVKASKLVVIMGAIELVSLFSQENSSISHLAHLGGLVTGFAYLRIKTWQRKMAAKKHQNWKYKDSGNDNVINVDFEKDKDIKNKRLWN
jgi:membrane associated rhomboid family serine protease